MKANELRIGNLFIDYTNKPFSWSLKHFELLASGIDLSEIIKHPVNLIGNRLEDFGFENNVKTIVHLKFEYFGENNLAISGMLGTIKPFKCKYVHELQNLYFALTGEELELKLTKNTIKWKN